MSTTWYEDIITSALCSHAHSLMYTIQPEYNMYNVVYIITDDGCVQKLSNVYRVHTII